MNTRNLVIKTKDAIFEHQFVSAHVFVAKFSHRKIVPRYTKSIQSNEFHSPRAARLIVETQDRIISYLLFKPFIISDNKGNIEVLTTALSDHVTQKTPYFTHEQIKEARNLSLVYKHKLKLGLTAEEVMEKAQMDAIIDVENARLIKIPFEIGGGF